MFSAINCDLGLKHAANNAANHLTTPAPFCPGFGAVFHEIPDCAILWREYLRPSAIDRWVEAGEAPESLNAYGTTAPPISYMAHPLDPDTIVTGRKLFQYPTGSVYDGSGDVADLQNWAKK